MKTAAVRLTRRERGKKPRYWTVRVRQITVGGFIDAIRVAMQSVSRFRIEVRKGEAVSERDVIMALSHPDVCTAVADILCPDNSRGWWKPWHSQENVLAMLEGASAVDDWNKLRRQLDFTGQGRKGRGSLMSDVIAIGQALGESPMTILEEWTMDRFIDLCEEMLEMAKPEESDDEPTPLEQLAGLHGVGVVH